MRILCSHLTKSCLLFILQINKIAHVKHRFRNSRENKNIVCAKRAFGLCLQNTHILALQWTSTLNSSTCHFYFQLIKWNNQYNFSFDKHQFSEIVSANYCRVIWKLCQTPWSVRNLLVSCHMFAQTHRIAHNWISENRNIKYGAPTF